MKTYVLDIQRSALHDGPGIRTTVFLKGCPLHCQWCHNPESQSFLPQLSYHSSRCTLCGACSLVCQKGAHTLSPSGHSFHRELCSGCGACAASCPSQALTVLGTARTPEEIFEMVLRDEPFYRTTGGGVTLSGGEPLSHPEFCEKLLRLCRGRGIHTCVETSGFVKPEALLSLIPLIDLFLYDCKITEDAKSIRYTGGPYSPIRSNLELICAHNIPVILRCPVIPGVNDHPRHFSAIADCLQNLPNVLRAELLPYHRFGEDKCRNTGLVFTPFPVPSAEEQQSWLDWFHSKGVVNVTIS